MPARVRLEAMLGALRARDHYSLPFRVSAKGGAVGADDAATLQAAIDVANLRAQDDHPDDPMWSTEVDLVGSELRAELAKGLMTEADVATWLSDLTDALRHDATD